MKTFDYISFNYISFEIQLSTRCPPDPQRHPTKMAVHFVSTVYPLVKGSTCAAGYDISSIDDAEVPAGERQLIHTGVFLHCCPPDYYVRIAPRSGLAAKHGVDVFAGVVDSDYRGEVIVVLFNSNRTAPLIINAGDRIAQLIVTHIAPHEKVVLEHMFDRRNTSPPQDEVEGEVEGETAGDVACDVAVIESYTGESLLKVPTSVVDAASDNQGRPFFQTRGTSGFGSTGVLNQRDQQRDQQAGP
jgi:dUTP pyrophosphatase